MSVHRVALIFDDRIRPDTTGVYVRRALAGLVEVVHFRPGQADAIPRTRASTCISASTTIPSTGCRPSLHPRAYWAIDTHRDFAARLRAVGPLRPRLRRPARRRRAAARRRHRFGHLAAAGVRPGRPSQARGPQAYDVAFVGHIFPGPRDELLRIDRPRVPRALHRPGLLRRDGADLLGQPGRLQPQPRQRREHAGLRGVGVRVAAGHQRPGRKRAGRALPGSRAPGDVSRAGRDAREASAITSTPCRRREAIAAAGRAEAVGRHTYRHRMERLLAEAERRLGRAVVAVGGREGLQSGQERREDSA